jgi:hypothetical protein
MKGEDTEGEIKEHRGRNTDGETSGETEKKKQKEQAESET